MENNININIKRKAPDTVGHKCPVCNKSRRAFGRDLPLVNFGHRNHGAEAEWMFLDFCSLDCAESFQRSMEVANAAR